MSEIAWAAGFFDGEGHVIRTNDSRTNMYGSLALGVAQKRPEPLERWRAAVDVTHRPLSPSGGDTHQVHVYGLQAFAVLWTLWPWLSEPKREQALEALSTIFWLGYRGTIPDDVKELAKKGLA